MRLALGTVQFGLPYGIASQSSQVPRALAGSIMQLAFESGIDMLDTAVAYGESEECIGEAGVGNFKIVTKLPALPDKCLDVDAWIQEQLGSSLLRLKAQQVYGLLLHRSQDLLGINGRNLYRRLQLLKEKGLVSKIGVSIYSPNELDLLTKNFHFDLVQAPFNLVDRRLLSTGWMQRLNNMGVEIHTRSTFLQGLLLMKPIDIPSKFSSWDYLWKIWQNWLIEHNISSLETSLAFPLSFSEINRVVVGIHSLNQLQEILALQKKPFTRNFPSINCDNECLINPSKWTGI